MIVLTNADGQLESNGEPLGGSQINSVVLPLGYSNNYYFTNECFGEYIDKDYNIVNNTNYNPFTFYVGGVSYGADPRNKIGAKIIIINNSLHDNFIIAGPGRFGTWVNNEYSSEQTYALPSNSTATLTFTKANNSDSYWILSIVNTPTPVPP